MVRVTNSRARGCFLLSLRLEVVAGRKWQREQASFLEYRVCKLAGEGAVSR